jgi:DNA-binding MarR family transcriptional regulator
MVIEESPTTSAHRTQQDDASRRATDVLASLRRYRAAEMAMRKRTRESLGLNETDLQAVTLLVEADRAERTVGPRDIAAELDISSASTTILVDRLVRSGFVERRPHPSDRRALVIAPTARALDAIAGTLGGTQDRMVDVARRLAPEDAGIVVDFLVRMREAVNSVDVDVGV